MWQPEPGWTALRPGSGASTVGLWRTDHHGRAVVIKRLRRPDADDPPGLSDPSHAGYWWREAEVALAPEVVDGPGLVPPAYLRVDEDDEGVTLWSEEVLAEPPPALQVARTPLAGVLEEDARLRAAGTGVSGRFLTVPDPRRGVLEFAIADACSVEFEIVNA